jgi:hypothetical protein
LVDGGAWKNGKASGFAGPHPSAMAALTRHWCQYNLLDPRPTAVRVVDWPPA